MATRQHEPGMSLAVLLAGWVEVDPASSSGQVTSLTLDSRQVRPGTLFIACSGLVHHGLEFLPQAVERGAVAVLCEPDENWSVADIQALQESIGIPLFPLPGLMAEVSAIAARFYDEPSQALTVIGITGTNGKTSCCHFLAQAFSPEQLCGVIGTVGNGLLGRLETATHTTPDAITLQGQLADLRQRGATLVAMEVSSHALDQQRAAAVRFDVAVLTNLTQDHLDYHRNMSAYAEAKQRLFNSPGLGCAVLNLDDPFSQQILAGLPDSVVTVGYTLDDACPPVVDHWVRAEHIVADYEGLALSIDSSWGQGQLKSRLLGRFNVSNLLAVLGVMLQQGIALDVALEKLSQLTTVTGRMERFGEEGQPLVVVDYAHTPDALRQALTALQEHVGGRLICVFGCGGDRDRSKRPLMGAVAEELADQLIITDDNPRTESGDAIIQEILDGIQDTALVQVERDRATAIALAISSAMPGDLVLVAGKGHEAYQQVGDQVLPFSDREQVAKSLTEVWP